MRNKVLYFLLLVPVALVYGQNCQEQLLDAERLYFNGQFDLVIEKLVDCDQGLTESEEEQRIVLLAQTYLIKGEDSLARASVEELLIMNPLYEVEYGALEKYSNLLDQYDIIPKWSWSLGVGVFAPELIIDKYHSYSSILMLAEEYETNLGFQAKLDGTYYALPWLPVRGSLSFRQFDYGYTDIILGAQAARFDERLQYIGFGISTGVSLNYGGWKMELMGGIMTENLVQAKADVSLIPTVEDIPVQGNPYPASANDVDSKGWRNNWNSSVVGELGIHKDFGLSSFGVSAQYQQGLSNITNSDERWSDPEFTYEYGYLPDDFTLVGWTFSVKYSRYIYHPKRRKP